jgi:hypothetical protein
MDRVEVMAELVDLVELTVETQALTYMNLQETEVYMVAVVVEPTMVNRHKIDQELVAKGL